ncbi:CHAT domain-containing protein [Nonomuraea sp. B19D2]|uniref:CHAT domain-containing protein n=1 Tax=Nonomuraea sp. B19D2 TaxID=3159561 RepID=UPI0032DB9C44
MRWRRARNKERPRLEVQESGLPPDITEQLKDPMVLGSVITMMRREVDRLPPGDDYRIEILAGLCTLLLHRFGNTGEADDLDQAVWAAGEAARTVRPAHPDRPGVLLNLHVTLLTRFERTDDLDDLDQGVRAGREGLAALPPDHPRRTELLVGLSRALRALGIRTGDTAHQSEAIEILRLVVQAMPEGHPDRADILAGLCNDLAVRFEVSSDVNDLHLAVRTAEEAVRASRDDVQRAFMQSNLALFLNRRYDWLDDLEDLEQAVGLLQEASAIIPTGHPERCVLSYNLSYALTRRFERLGVEADMNDAVAAARAAVATDSEEFPRMEARRNLGNALRHRFIWAEELDDLNEAIQELRAALDDIEDDHPGKPRYLSDLANALRSRFDHTAGRLSRTGASADLDEAIDALRQAVHTTPDANAAKVDFLHNLSIALVARFRLARRAEDLDEALVTALESLRVIADRPKRMIYQQHLASTLLTRFDHRRDRADLERAIDLLRQAIAACPADHAERVVMLANLAGALIRGLQFDDAPDRCDEAVRILEEAARLAREGTPHWAPARGLLGEALAIRFRRTDVPADAEAAISLWREVACAGVAPLSDRIAAAGNWGTFAASLERWPEALAAHSTAVELLPLVAWRGAGRTDREHFLAEWNGLGSAAAACAIAAGQPQQALDLLEQGRGVLWSQLLQTHTDLSALATSVPDLARRLQEVRAALDAPAGAAGRFGDGAGVADRFGDGAGVAGVAPAWSDRAVDRQLALAQEWEDLVAQARTLPGSEDFLRHRGADRLPAAGSDGPVVVINVSPWRCDALAVTAEGVRVVPLPSLTAEDTVERANGYLTALRRHEQAHQDRAARAEFERTITATLEWLWDAVAEPVLTALGHTHAPAEGEDWPRVWWSPTGPLAFLPLHAAGYHDRGDAGAVCSVMDRVVSSYAPTLRALTRARAARPSQARPAVDGLLMVAMPTTPGQAPLPHVLRERDLLARLFGAEALTVLQSREASRRAVRDALGSCRWAHVACHGTQDLTDPFRGGLLLADGFLTIAELGQEHTGHGEFAFVSACWTAVGGVALVDEAISTVAALHHAGWRHVIGTLWAVWDAAAADITRNFYSRQHQLTDGAFSPDTAALALHHAVRALRDRDRARPSLWAPFVHTGP